MQAVTPAVGDKQYEFMYDYMGRRAIAFVSHYDGSEIGRASCRERV